MFGLWFIKSRTTETLRRRLVEALVLPYLDYCSVVYHSGRLSGTPREVVASEQYLCEIHFWFKERRSHHSL